MPSAQRCPKPGVIHAGEVGNPRGSNPFVEAGEEVRECHEWPDLCMATDNYSSFIICQGRRARQSLTTHFWLPVSARKSLQRAAINQPGPREQGLGGRSSRPPTL